MLLNKPTAKVLVNTHQDIIMILRFFLEFVKTGSLKSFDEMFYE